MKITFDEWINNPTGKSGRYADAEKYRSQYMQSLKTVMEREKQEVYYKLYRSHDKYYAHFKIPSDKINNFYYDVVIEFSEPSESKYKNTPSLKHWTVRFFANDPAFFFAAKTYNKNGLFIDDFEKKLPKGSFDEKPDEEEKEMKYIKSIYYAYLLMNQRGLFSKDRYNEKFNKTIFMMTIDDPEKKLSGRQDKADELAQKKRFDKMEKLLKDAKNPADMVKAVKKSNVIKYTKVARTVKKVKRSKIIGKK